VERAIFDPGVTVSPTEVSVFFAVEEAVASSVDADATVVSSGGFVVADNDGEECDVEDNVTAIAVDDVVIVVTEDVTLVAVVIDDVGTIGVDDVVNDVVGDVTVFLSCAVDEVKVIVVVGVDDDVTRVSTGAVDDVIMVDEVDEVVGEGVTSRSPGIGQ